jgi:hypothetical protein
VLPLAGGLFDQPGVYLGKMEQIIEARDEKERLEREKNAGRERLDQKVRGK